MQQPRPLTAAAFSKTELQRKEHEVSQLRIAAIRALEQQVGLQGNCQLCSRCQQACACAVGNHLLTKHLYNTTLRSSQTRKASTNSCRLILKSSSLTFSIIFSCWLNGMLSWSRQMQLPANQLQTWQPGHLQLASCRLNLLIYKVVSHVLIAS